MSDIIDEYLNIVFDFDIDLEMVIDEALKYDKIYESNVRISKEILLEILI